MFRNQSVGRGGLSVSYNRLQAERRAKQKRTCASLCVCGIGIIAWACAVIDYSVPEKNLFDMYSKRYLAWPFPPSPRPVMFFFYYYFIFLSKMGARSGKTRKDWG